MGPDKGGWRRCAANMASHGGELFNPQFRRVADKIFSRAERGWRPIRACPPSAAPYVGS